MQRRTTWATKAGPRLLAILIALLVLGMVWGQTRTVLAVSDELDARQELHGDDLEIDAENAGQGFQTTQSGSITRISLWTYSGEVNNDVTITVNVRQGNPTEDGGSLGTATRSFANMSTVGAWVDFVFDTPIPVTGGTPYYYKVTYTSSSNIVIRLGYKLTSPGNSPYADGDSWSPAIGGGWEQWGDADFTFRVYLAQNQDPVLATNAGLSAYEGAESPIANTDLKVTDADGDTITYTIGTVPVNGALKRGATTLAPGSTFTQDDIDAGNLTYVHDGSETTSDSFTFTVDDGNGGTIDNTTFMITVTPVNDPPTFNLGANVEVAEDSGAYAQANFLTDASAVEAGQTILSTTVSNNNNALFSAQPAIDGTGKLTFTPAANAYGTATVTVAVRDDGGTASGGQDTATQTFTITITPVNDPPSFTPGPNQTVSEDAGAQTVSAWATGITAGPNEPTQTVTFTVTNTNNSLFSVQPAVNPTGALTYTPAKDAFGIAMLTVKADDGQAENNESAPATITITLVAVNDQPVAVDDVVFGTSEDSGEIRILADLLGNDSPGPANESDQTLTIAGVANGTGGTVRRDGSAIYFTPAANFHGDATFTYTVSDGAGGTDTARVTVPVSPVADTPTITNKTIDEDTDATGLVIGRNAVDGAEVTHFQITWAADLRGTLKRNDGTPIANGAFITAAEGLGGLTFTPNTDANGTFTFTVAAATSAAGTGLSDTVTFNVIVNPVNDAPEANDDDLGTKAEDAGPWEFSFADLTANDFDGPETATDEREANTLTVISVGGPGGAATGGTVALHKDNQLVIFTPTEHYNGPAEFIYTVEDSGGATNTATARFTITQVNDPPEGVDDELSAVDEDSGVRTIAIAALLANDRPGPDGAPGEGRLDQTLSITAVTAVAGATKVEIVGGDILFHLAPNFHGTATFTYTVQDDGTPVGTDVVTVTFPVNNVAETPSVSPVIVAEDTRSDAGLVITPNPEDEGAVTHFKVDAITGGTLYKRSGATVVALADGDFITAAEGAAGLKFQPEADQYGTTGFGFSVAATLDAAGKGQSDFTAVTIVVTEVNDPPNARDDLNIGTSPEDTEYLIRIADLTANDETGAANEDQELTFNLGVAFNGAVAVSEGGLYLIFTPDKDYAGPASFAYTITDNGTTAGNPDPRTSGIATVSFEITPVPEEPTIEVPTAGNIEDTNVLVKVKPNTADTFGVTKFVLTGITGGQLRSGLDSPPLSLNETVTVAQGSDGLYFTPDPDRNSVDDGEDYFTVSFRARDGWQNVTGPEATVTITIAEENDPPTANADTVTKTIDNTDILEDAGAIKIRVADLLANDEPGAPNESRTLRMGTVAAVTGGSGIPTYDPDTDADHVYFTPNEHFYGDASFEYTLEDYGTTEGVEDVETDTATVTITIKPVVDVPSVPHEIKTGEEIMSGLIMLDRHAKDGAEVTHFLITKITGGTLYHADGLGSGAIANGTLITYQQGVDGLRFRPDNNLNSPAGNTFSFQVQAASATGAGTSAPVTATITVWEVNDSPTGVADTYDTQVEDAGGPWLIPISRLLANDLVGPGEDGQQALALTLPDPATLSEAEQAVGGTVAINAAGTHVEFTPTAHFNGTARFIYVLTDNGTTGGKPDPLSHRALVEFTVTSINDAPIGVADTLPDVAEDTGPWAIPFATLLANDTAGPANEGDQNLTIVGVVTTLAGAQIKVEGSDVIFTPPLHYNGEATFTYTLQDDGTTAGSPDPQTAQAHVRFTITPINDAPVADDKALSVTVGNTLKERVSATDVDRDPVTYALVGGPTLGTVTMNPDGSFTYVSTRTGLDTFTYKASDGIADSNVATVSVQVRGRVDAEPFVPVLSIRAPVTETRERSIVVSGSANPGYRVVVGGTAVLAGSDGGWSATVSLEEGPNVITASHSGLSRSVTVVRDTTPPMITFTASESRTESESVVLTATANEEGARVTIEGQKTTSLTVKLSMGQNRFSATATDRLGNQSTATLSVLRVGRVLPVLRQAGPGETAEASMLNFSVRIPGESVTQPVRLRVLAPTAETGALRLAEDAAQVVGTGDADVTTQDDATPLSEVMATVTFGYDPALLADPKAVRIYYFAPKWQVWVELGGTVDPERHTVTVQVGHLTTFAALVPSISAPVLAQPPAEVETDKLTVTGTALPETPVTLVVNGDSQNTVMTDAEGRYTMVGTLSKGRNWLYVKSTGALASREYGVTYRSYTDIDGHWAEATVDRLARLRILSLYPRPLFRPEERVSRLEFAVMVARVLELRPLDEAPTFADTDEMAVWARPEVAAAVKAGIIKGMPDGSFAPNAPVTRAEMAIMLTRALGYAGRDTSPGEKRFADHAGIPEWALAQVQTAARYGLITGYPDGSFQPSNGTTRAEAVTMLERLLGQVK